MMTRRSALSLLPATVLFSAERRPLEFDIRWVNPPAKAPPRVSHKTLLSKAMGCEVGFNLYLPPNYERSSERYPVLYWLHGGGGDESSRLATAEMLDGAIAAGQMPPVIMVLPNGGKRSEYRDWEPQKVMPESFIIRELLPHI